jgi:ribosomal protein L14
MIQKLSKVIVADRTGVNWLQTFHIYRGSWRRYAFIGDYIKMSVKSIIRYPKRIRSKRYRPIRVGFRCRGLVTQLLKNKIFYDRSNLTIFHSTVILLKKRGTFKSKAIYGSGIRNLRRRQYYELFNYFV